jgi:Trk K+ transport system NAD-binding subunit
VNGDGSSRLVLRDAGAEAAQVVVACTGSDEVNLEVLRVVAELGVERRYALMRAESAEPAYRDSGVEAVNLRDACSALLESRIERHKVATAVGLGEGEIIEVTVMPGSSATGSRLRDLHPRKWLVGAIYREGKLVVPHGDTVIGANDRVLLVGDPNLLPSIASHLRTGEPQFPLHYGSNIVVAAQTTPVSLCEEVDYLLRSSEARGVVLLGVPGSASDPSALGERCERAGKPLALVTVSDASDAALAAEAAKQDAGLIVLPPVRLPLLSRIGLTRSSLARVAQLAEAPLLVPRGTIPYLRVMIVLAEVPFDQRAAQLAIDLVRTVGGKLQLGVVHQPELVVGARMREELEVERRQIEELARMFRVDLQVRVMEGNPIAQLVRQSRELNALVVPYPRQRRPSLMRPDVGQNLAHLARCSTYLVPC